MHRKGGRMACQKSAGGLHFRRVKKTCCMAKVCAVTGKTPNTAHNVSHSNVKTKRRQFPNLQNRVIVNPATGKKERVLISTRGLKTLMKWAKEGKQVDITSLNA